METFGLALSTPKKPATQNAPIIADQKVMKGKVQPTEEMEISATQTRSKSNLKRTSQSDSLSQNSSEGEKEGRVGKDHQDSENHDSHSCRASNEGSPSANLSQFGSDCKDSSLELSFIYNPTSPPQIEIPY